jgi:predicted transport protein
MDDTYICSDGKFRSPVLEVHRFRNVEKLQTRDMENILHNGMGDHDVVLAPSSRRHDNMNQCSSG